MRASSVIFALRRKMEPKGIRGLAGGAGVGGGVGAVFGAGGAAIVAVATGVVGEAEAALAGFGSDFAGVDSASVFDFPFDASVSGALRFNRRMALVWLIARRGSASAISSSMFFTAEE